MVERFGRRNFLIGGALWMSFCNLIVGATAVGAAGTQAASNVLVVFTLLFIAGFASTWGPGAWVRSVRAQKTLLAITDAL
jgi:SP family sugar:H+ symporter-like MFS transporter